MKLGTSLIKSIAAAALAVVAIAFAPSSPAVASPIVASYTTAGDTTGTGPWTMTSTDSTFSILRFIPATPIKFQDWTSLIVSYDAVLGGIAAGAPRFTFVLDFDGNNTVDGTFDLQWGPPGTFADPTLGVGNTGNLLALTDVGRYDLTGIGGSVYTDRATALAMAGNYYVLRASLVIDSFGGNDRNFIIYGISGDANDAVPEPTTTAVLAVALLLMLGLFLVRRRTA